MDDACYGAVWACLLAGTGVVDRKAKSLVLNPARGRLLGGQRVALVGQPLHLFLEHKVHDPTQPLSWIGASSQAPVRRQRTALKRSTVAWSAGLPNTSRWRARP